MGLYGVPRVVTVVYPTVPLDRGIENVVRYTPRAPRGVRRLAPGGLGVPVGTLLLGLVQTLKVTGSVHELVGSTIRRPSW